MPPLCCLFASLSGAKPSLTVGSQSSQSDGTMHRPLPGLHYPGNSISQSYWSWAPISVSATTNAVVCAVSTGAAAVIEVHEKAAKKGFDTEEEAEELSA